MQIYNGRLFIIILCPLSYHSKLLLPAILAYVCSYTRANTHKKWFFEVLRGSGKKTLAQVYNIWWGLLWRGQNRYSWINKKIKKYKIGDTFWTYLLLYTKHAQLLIDTCSFRNATESRSPKTFAPYVRNGVIKVLTNLSFNEECQYDAVNQSLRRTK